MTNGTQRGTHTVVARGLERHRTSQMSEPTLLRLLNHPLRYDGGELLLRARAAASSVRDTVSAPYVMAIV